MGANNAVWDGGHTEGHVDWTGLDGIGIGNLFCMNLALSFF